jgi:anaerobic selenocysteine-containing dehydrogenase
MTKTVYRTCTLCEAACGLAIDVDDGRVVAVRGDEDDVASRGYLCAKGVAIGAVHDDPDRLRRPVKRLRSGEFVPVGWDEAFDDIVARLKATQAAHGNDAVALYVGNPVIHNHGAILLRQSLMNALGTRNTYSASSQDTAPRFATSFHLYGSALAGPVPDIDRSDYFLCIGANPYVSNGSAWTVPNVKGRMRALRQRGGRLVVIDPRRSETAREADEFVQIRPGTDHALLFAMASLLLEEGLVDTAAVDAQTRGFDEVARRLRRVDRDAAAAATGIERATIERLAREFAGAKNGVAYSRIGVCNNRFGTLATWATDLLNILAGRLGKVGGAMFPKPAIDLLPVAKLAKMEGHGRWRSRVRGLPETIGDLPSACLAEEIDTPGPGQVRALLTFAGNPVLSVPNTRRMRESLGRLDLMVSIDLYVNETTRHADYILPPSGSLAEDHVDVLFPAVAARNVARWSPPVVHAGPDERADWQILLELIERLGGGPMGMAALDVPLRWAKMLGWRWEPTAMLDTLLRLGPYGDRFLPWSDGLNMEKLKAAPHGIDLGPLTEGIAHRIAHGDGKVQLAPAPFVEAMDAWLGQQQIAAEEGTLSLIGRRDVRTNNSWMHNIEALAAGRDRCVLLVHPQDAARAGVTDDTEAELQSAVHTGVVRVKVSDEMMPGVVSLPHGWGHAETAPWQRVAPQQPGVSANDWTNDQDVEAVVGQSILNGVAVRLRALPA